MDRVGTTRSRYEHACQLVDQGLKIPEACAQAKVSTVTFYKYRKEASGKALTTTGYRKARSRRRLPEPVQIVVPESDEEVRIVVMKGKASAIQEIAKALGGVL